MRAYPSFSVLLLALLSSPRVATAFQTTIPSRAPQTVSHTITSTTGSPQTTQRYLSTDDDSATVAPPPPPPASLSSQQDDDLRKAGESLTEEFGYSWFNKDEAWEAFGKEYPQMAEEFTQEQLKTAYIQQSPKLLDLFTKTPLGPVLLINLIFLATGFSWCDTPFHQDGAQCPPPLL